MVQPKQMYGPAASHRDALDECIASQDLIGSEDDGRKLRVNDLQLEKETEARNQVKLLLQAAHAERARRQRENAYREIVREVALIAATRMTVANTIASSRETSNQDTSSQAVSNQATAPYRTGPRKRTVFDLELERGEHEDKKLSKLHHHGLINSQHMRHLSGCPVAVCGGKRHQGRGNARS